MKKIIPLIALMLLAGCGNNSTENQSSPANPAASEPPSGPGATGVSNNSPATETATNGPATNSGAINTNGPAAAN